MQPRRPLRFRISNWHQLPGVESNNSRKLSIGVSDIIQHECLTGCRIMVVHEDFGPLFTCVVGAEGTMVTPLTDDGIVMEFTPKQILAELEKYGFFIEYHPVESLPEAQVSYLFGLRNLGYDKIRVLNVHQYVRGVKQFRWVVVVFRIKENSQWINNWFSPSEAEFTRSLRNGSALNISTITREKQWSWSWLDWVANIDDIIDAQNEVVS